MSINQETRIQRGLDLNAALGRYKHILTLKDVCEDADLNYNSTVVALNRLTSKGIIHAISDRKLEILHHSLLKLVDSKVQTPQV